MKPVTLSPGFGDNRPTATLYYGQDVRKTLRSLPEASVHTVCTSPPYWGLRDYGTGDAQIGLEETPESYVANMVEVFREAKRVLRPDGTLWVNLGDSYAGHHGNKKVPDDEAPSNKNGYVENMRATTVGPSGLKAKDLVGIPWRVAFALQADGWYLRQDIIWAKDSCMPESATDRCTKAHEYVFLFAHPDSGGRYFYDAEAVKEPLQVKPHRPGNKKLDASRNDHKSMGKVWGLGGKRNRRSVWRVNPKPYSGSHFAVWPPDLVEPMIKAGTSERGCCPTCKKPWERIVERDNPSKWAADDDARGWSNTHQTTSNAQSSKSLHRNGGGVVNTATTVGWQPACTCDAGASVPCTVLDPFSGSATTGMVALREGRNYIGIDLNPDYLPLAEARLREDPAPREADDDEDRELDLFDLFGEEDSE